MQFGTVCVAGTFEGIHKGHQVLLAHAFLNGKKVIIGLTSDKFPKKKSPYRVRKQALEDWLAERFAGRFEIFPLDDPIGPAVTATFDALLVTSQNKHIGEKINSMRTHPLVLIEVPMLSAEDTKPISTTRIKNGEIDASGRLVMPDSMRKELAQPLGAIVTAFTKQGFIITVGDMTTKTCIEQGIEPNVAIIDNKVNRKHYRGLHDWKRRKTTTKVSSGPGFISQEAIDVIAHLPSVLEVDGEEDLLVLPAIVAAPLDSFLYYGQPKKGIVEVYITETIKKKAIAYMARFIQ